jgi:hypothetical protein
MRLSINSLILKAKGDTLLCQAHIISQQPLGPIAVLMHIQQHDSVTENRVLEHFVAAYGV